MTCPESIAVTRVSGRNTRRRAATSTTSPTARGAPLGRTSTTTSRTRPTWSPRGSNTLVPARRATNTLVPTLLTSVSLDRAPGPSAAAPPVVRPRVTGSSRPGDLCGPGRGSRHVVLRQRPPPAHPDAAAGRDGRGLRHLPRGAEGRRPPRRQGVPGAAGDDRRHRPEDGRAGHRTALLPAGGARRVPVRGVVRPVRRAPAQPVLHARARRARWCPRSSSAARSACCSRSSRTRSPAAKRDFTSTSQIVASSYAVLCRPEQAHKARELLREIGGVQSGWPAPSAGADHHHQPVGSVGCVPTGCGLAAVGLADRAAGRAARTTCSADRTAFRPARAARAADRAAERAADRALRRSRNVGSGSTCGASGSALCTSPQREALREQQCDGSGPSSASWCRGRGRLAQVVTRDGSARSTLSRRADPPSTPRRRPGRGAARPTGSRCRPR